MANLVQCSVAVNLGPGGYLRGPGGSPAWTQESRGGSKCSPGEGGTVCSVQCVVYILNCAVCSVLCALCSV